LFVAFKKKKKVTYFVYFSMAHSFTFLFNYKQLYIKKCFDFQMITLQFIS